MENDNKRRICIYLKYYYNTINKFHNDEFCRYNFWGYSISYNIENISHTTVYDIQNLSGFNNNNINLVTLT